jgi:hypothetical protein
VHFRRSPSQIKAPTLANNNYLFVKFLTFFGCVDLTLEGDGGDGVVERVHDLVVDHASVAKSVLKEKNENCFKKLWSNELVIQRDHGFELRMFTIIVIDPFTKIATYSL